MMYPNSDIFLGIYQALQFRNILELINSFLTKCSIFILPHTSPPPPEIFMTLSECIEMEH